MRPVCSGCARPVSVCLCDVIPSPPLKLQTRLLILQHPHELKQKLATVPVLFRCVHPCHVVVGRRLNSSNWPFAPSDGAGHTLLLFPGLDAMELKLWSEVLADREQVDRVEDSLPRLMQVVGNSRDSNEHNYSIAEEIGEDSKSKGLSSSKFIRTGIDERHIANAQATFWEITLVVLDGTWEHAQEMVKASLPFLSTFVTQVCLPFDIRSEGYGMGESDLIIRKEPYGGCVSTMEAVARALATLEPDGHFLEIKLMDVLRKMVSLQASYFSVPKIRPKLKKKSKECVPNT